MELPNIKSAKKRVKVSAKKSLRNRMIKNGLRTSVKKFEANVSADQLSQTVSAIDMAAAKGVIHKNAANRKKARLAKALAKASV
jgi:small subunit ribosomal protein S20